MRSFEQPIVAEAEKPEVALIRAIAEYLAPGPSSIRTACRALLAEDIPPSQRASVEKLAALAERLQVDLVNIVASTGTSHYRPDKPGGKQREPRSRRVDGQIERAVREGRAQGPHWCPRDPIIG